ncbi:hypothetical protein STVA_25330 [Allostella vacuolata]|nr:hypothetical protein STVA_25330 [Stella vacuolata]
MQALIAALISLFLVEPLQRDLADALAAGGAPQDLVRAVATCAADQAPRIIDRAIDDPWWATSSAFSVWIGLAEPHALLIEAAPGCSAAIQAARPFLDPGEGLGA